MTGVTAMVAAGAVDRLFNFRVTISQTYSTNTTQTTLNVSTLSGYVAGATDVTITVNNGIYLYSTDTASAALTISGATAGDRVYLVNNGFIMGKGGDAGSNGGPALSLATPTFITNNSYIAGGGGGGGKFLAFGNAPTYQTAAQSDAGGGGGWGAAGGLALSGTYARTAAGINSGAGGSASAAGFNAYDTATDGSAGTRGSGGKAINLNGYSVTYITTGSIFGAVS